MYLIYGLALPLKDSNTNEGLKYPEVFKSTFFQVKPRERSQGHTYIIGHVKNFRL